MSNTKKSMQIILDTDMGNDIDDALALAMIHALQSRGECELIGVITSKHNPYSAAYIDAVNTFYCRALYTLHCDLPYEIWCHLYIPQAIKQYQVPTE